MTGNDPTDATGRSGDATFGGDERDGSAVSLSLATGERTCSAACRALVTDDRGQAEQIDFLNGMIILLFGVGLFFAGGSVLFSIGVDSSPDHESAVLNADQRLVEDVLVSDVGETELDRACADAYFELNASGVCTRADGVVEDSMSEQQWLRQSLGLEDELRVNVTVVDDGSVVTSPAGVEYSLGPSPPPDAEVFESNRFVTFGGGEYDTVLVRVW
jgi:hypothetical protein